MVVIISTPVFRIFLITTWWSLIGKLTLILLISSIEANNLSLGKVSLLLTGQTRIFSSLTLTVVVKILRGSIDSCLT